MRRELVVGQRVRRALLELAPAGGPSGEPSERTTSPVSTICLKRRRSSLSWFAGSSPNSFATSRRPRRRAGCSAGRRAPRCPGRRAPVTKRTVPVLSISALDRAPGDPLAGHVLGDLGVPFDRHAGGPRAFQCEVRRPGRADRLEVRHEVREALEVAPQRVDLGTVAADRDRGRDLHRRLGGRDSGVSAATRAPPRRRAAKCRRRRRARGRPTAPRARRPRFAELMTRAPTRARGRSRRRTPACRRGCGWR